MALIVCPECGREISDTAEKCVHCGYATGKVSAESTPVAKSKKKSGMIAIVFVILMVVIGILYVCFFGENSNVLSEDEQYACELVRTLQVGLRYPDSLKLKDDIVLLKFEDGDVYTVIKYEAENRNDDIVIGRAIFKNGMYCCDYDDTNLDWDSAVAQALVAKYYHDELENAEIVKVDVDVVKVAITMDDE